jgi:hypothetical protein
VERLRRHGQHGGGDRGGPGGPDGRGAFSVFRFRFHLPGKVVHTGYGTFWPEKAMGLDHYKRLARETGFEIATAEQQAGAFQTVTLELRKPK